MKNGKQTNKAGKPICKLNETKITKTLKQSDTQEQTKKSNSEEFEQNLMKGRKNGKKTPRVQSHGRVLF